MKNKLLFLILQLICLTVLPAEESESFIFNDALLNEKDIQRKTLLGDLESTDEYLNFLHTNNETTTLEIIMWEEIASENELLNVRNIKLNVNMYNYALTLHDIENESIRAIYWLNKSNIESSDYLYQKLSEQYYDLLCLNQNKRLPLKVDKLKDLAKIGSKQAAKKLYNYYMKKKKVNEALYWLHIGAQNGDKECIKEYVIVLKKSKNEFDTIRAEIWENSLQS